MTTLVPILETDRLLLRGWSGGDFAPLAAFYADDAGARFVGGTMTSHDAWRRLAAFIGHWQLKGFGPFALEDKATGAWVGWCALWQPPEFPEIEMGYTLGAAWRGKGYATEACQAVRRFAFARIGLPTLVSYIVPENAASQRVAERLGARRDGTIVLRGTPVDVWRHTWSERGDA